MRTLRYRAIADELRRRVERGDFAAGALLPSEAELSGEFGASRVVLFGSLNLGIDLL